MNVAVVKETYPGEHRVAAVPSTVNLLIKAGHHIWVERGAGVAAGFPDALYEAEGARIVDDRDELFQADVILQVRCLGLNPEHGRADLEQYQNRQIVIGMCDPLGEAEKIREIAAKGVTLFALEMIPRITRAQSMDVLSSMATIAGYKSVLIAANHLPRIFPMLMTAAGTIKAARVFVLGAGVAGLQAIASARRLGAIVQAYDVRPVVREQVESLGASFVELKLDTSDAEGAGGYAKQLSEEDLRQQRAQLADVIAENDVCISTAAIPGKESPLLITAEAVERMQPGSVIIDLATERGGNCELSQQDKTIVEHGVTIAGPTNLPAEVPYHASQMFARNVATFLKHLTQDDATIQIDCEDEITRETLAAYQGEVYHARLRSILGLDERESDTGEAKDATADPSQGAEDELELESGEEPSGSGSEA